MAGKADREVTLLASACQIGESNSVNPGKILLVYNNNIKEENTSLLPIRVMFVIRKHLALLTDNS